MQTNNLAEQYIDDVLTGKAIVCEYTMLSVERHVNDLKTGRERGLYFNSQSAIKAMEFFQFLNHTKGSQFSNKPFILSPWQAFVVWCVFGWKNEDGTRRFRYSYLDIARKNGKTTFAAAIGLYLLTLDNEAAAEIYSVATKKDQAKICFTDAKNMVKTSPVLKQIVTIFQHNLHIESTFSKFEPLGADSDTLDGLNPHGVVIDEFHAHKTDALFNVMKSAAGARMQPLIFIVTTAGFNIESPCYKYRLNAIQILKGIKQDDSLFAIIFTLDDKEDWKKPEEWVKANPNLDISVNLKYIQSECKQAINLPTQEVNFKTKNANIWVDSADTWISDDIWKLNNKGRTLAELENQECYGGLDISSTKDLTSFQLWFPNGEKHDLISAFWIPEKKLHEMEDRVNYRVWSEKGFIFVTPGNIIDYKYVIKHIVMMFGIYDIKSIAFDARMAYSGIVQDLIIEDIPMNPFGQSIGNMSAPTKEFERVILEYRLNHFNHPVLRWNMANVNLYSDINENIKPDKKRSFGRIDGVVASVMAYGEYLSGADESSNYEERGILSI